MNLISKLYRMWQIRFGTLEVGELEHLSVIYMEYQNPLKSDVPWMSLYAWRKLTKEDSEYFMKLYLKYHTADEGLFKSEWLMKQELIRHAYLHSLCTRKIPYTKAEEKWILESGEPGATRCLLLPLSANSEYQLIYNGSKEQIEGYIVSHVLREAGEAQLAISASDKSDPVRAEMYRKLLKRYFECQSGIYGHKLFTDFMAQWSLFADENNDEFIMKVIEQCDMDDCFMEPAMIRRMVKMNPKYLIWYLSYSYIYDRDVVSELLAMDLPEHLRDMIAISEQRSSIHEIAVNSMVYVPDDWSRAELDAYAAFDHEDDDEKRMVDLKAFLEPRFKEGTVSPTMSAWVAARCPEFTKDVMVNLSRLETRALNRVMFFNPLDLHHSANELY